jgi:hypothetical protein
VRGASCIAAGSLAWLPQAYVRRAATGVIPISSAVNQAELLDYSHTRLRGASQRVLLAGISVHDAFAVLHLKSVTATLLPVMFI